jgi:hypothetical protein
LAKVSHPPAEARVLQQKKVRLISPSADPIVRLRPKPPN